MPKFYDRYAKYHCLAEEGARERGTARRIEKANKNLGRNFHPRSGDEEGITTNEEDRLRRVPINDPNPLRLRNLPFTRRLGSKGGQGREGGRQRLGHSG
jgi:hypothetical protein